MSYVDAALAPQRKPDRSSSTALPLSEGMRKAGRLVARCLDMLADEVRPEFRPKKIDRLVFEFAMDHQATPGR